MRTVPKQMLCRQEKKNWSRAPIKWDAVYSFVQNSENQTKMLILTTLKKYSSFIIIPNRLNSSSSLAVKPDTNRIGSFSFSNVKLVVADSI